MKWRAVFKGYEEREKIKVVEEKITPEEELYKVRISTSYNEDSYIMKLPKVRNGDDDIIVYAQSQLNKDKYFLIDYNGKVYEESDRYVSGEWRSYSENRKYAIYEILDLTIDLYEDMPKKRANHSSSSDN